MNEDGVYITTRVTESFDVRPSMVLKADGEPYYIERKKEKIGFDLRSPK
jgi:hypothetical protein